MPVWLADPVDGGKIVRLNTTLRLTRPFGFTLLLTLAVLALLIALLEGLARLPWVEAHVPTAIGSAHQDIDIKFGELDAQLNRTGQIDCIFVGSSMVHRGIDPAIFTRAYYEQTGDDIVCYNFGVRGSRASGMAPLSDILIERYHPRLLIYGLSLRDLTGEPFQNDQQEAILASPWLDYQFGSFNLEGWLIEHSESLRHFLAFHDWLLSKYEDSAWCLDDWPCLGYSPSTTRSGSALIRESAPRSFRFTQVQWNGLEHFLSLRTQTQLLFVEMPPSYRQLTSIKGGEETYRSFLYDVRDFVAGYDIPMLTTIDLDLIPDSGWSDMYHLHQTGAAAFSAWLGDRVGAAVSAGEITLPDG
jgi:hypothetical protein